MIRMSHHCPGLWPSCRHEIGESEVLTQPWMTSFSALMDCISLHAFFIFDILEFVLR